MSKVKHIKKLVVACVATLSWTQSSAAMPVVDAPLAALVTAFTAVTFPFAMERILIGMQGATTAINSTTAKAATDTQKAMATTAAGVEQGRAASRYQMIDPCSVTAGTVGMNELIRNSAAKAAKMGRRAGGSGGAGGGSRSSALKKVLDYTAEKVPVPTKDAQLVNSAAAGCQAFSTSNSRGRACQVAGLSRSFGDNATPDADVVAETLFEGPQYDPSNPVSRLTVAKDGADRTALNAFMRNLVAPLGLSDLKDGALATDSGRRYMAMKDVYDSRLAFAEYPVRRYAAYMTEDERTKPALTELMGSATRKAWVEKELNRSYPAWKTRGISHAELMNLEVMGRYTNRDWKEAMGRGSPEAAIKEHVEIAAFQSVLLNKMLDEMRLTNTLLGGMNLDRVRADLMPKLEALHAAAQR